MCLLKHMDELEINLKSSLYKGKKRTKKNSQSSGSVFYFNLRYSFPFGILIVLIQTQMPLGTFFILLRGNMKFTRSVIGSNCFREHRQHPPPPHISLSLSKCMAPTLRTCFILPPLFSDTEKEASLQS